jgi:hypothetical protein
MPNLTREDFLKLLAVGGTSFLGLGGMASAEIPDPTALKGPLVPWGRLKFVGENGDTEDWHVHPHGDVNLMDLLRDDTSINLEKKWNVADVSDLSSMTPYPFLFMHGELAPQLDDTARKNIREYLLRGGFLYAEDCVNGYGHHGSNNVNDFFFQGMKAEFPLILPEAKIEVLTTDHPIFHCFFHFDEWPHMQGTRWGPHGIILDGHLVALLSPSDLHCGWTNGDNWFGPGMQQRAMQMGANIYIYAMTRSAS